MNPQQKKVLFSAILIIINSILFCSGCSRGKHVLSTLSPQPDSTDVSSGGNSPVTATTSLKPSPIDVIIQLDL